MAFRFQKRIKIAPGIRMNLSKSGVSASIGGRGATVNLNTKGVRSTVGIPGSGLSWSQQTGWSESRRLKPADEFAQLGRILEKLAESCDDLPRKAEKVTERWHKAIASFEGGRGPSASKLTTLQKRFEKVDEGYQNVIDAAEDQRLELQAVINRLTAMKFGFFSGRKKDTQKVLIEAASKLEDIASETRASLYELAKSTENELSAAEDAI